MNIANLLTQTAASVPDHPALVFEGRSLSYGDLDRQTARFAHALNDQGMAPGEVLAIYLESCPELVIAFLGAVRTGVVPNVVNAFLKPEEVRHVVGDSGAKLLVTDPGRHDALAPMVKAMGIDRAVVTGWAHDVGRDRALDSFLDHRPDSQDTLDLPERALASLLYTSGTTGHPKGVMLSHRNVVDNALNFSATHYRADCRLLVAAPLFHCWGLINGVLGAFAVGASAILIRRFQTEPVLDLIEQARPSAMIGVPTMYSYMARSPGIERRDLSSLEFVLSAAAPTPMELVGVLRDRWKVGYAESYGLTETSPVITTTHHTEYRPGSCGRAMGDTRLKVTGPLGRDLGPGEPGELWAAGTAVSGGYFQRPDATAEVFTPDGWFKTGDVARIDEDGFVTIVDRLKDMINVAGFKVYPRDVEEVLHRHPAVADAVVIGVPDFDRGEVVKAFVVRTPGVACTADDLTEFVRPVLADFKVPRVIEFTEEIPRSPSGKALRRLLR